MTEANIQWDSNPAGMPYHGAGAVSAGGGILFRAAFPTDGEVSLLLYLRGEDQILAEIPMPLNDRQGLWRCVRVTGVKASQIEYNYRVDGRVRQDPAAALISGRDMFGDVQKTTTGQIRCRIPGGSFDWQDEKGPLHLPYEDVVSYLLHVRGFTKQKGSRVRHPGTFKGIEEKIPYLKELGINQIILMPAYEFDEIMRPETEGSGAPYTDQAAGSDMYRLNYWGYGNGWYFAPKASYAAGAKPDIEFKSMVRALHLAGIEIVMEFAFADGTDVEYMGQCLSWWNREYHVDGFLLMTAQENIHALASLPALRLTKLISAYFDTKVLYPHGRKVSSRMAADCNDGFRNDMRRMLKGDGGMLRDFVERTRANSRDKAVMNYITNHDGFTLNDLVTYGQKYNEANGEGGRDGNPDELSWNCGAEGPTRKKSIQKLRLRQMKNAMAMLLLAQGTPILLAGDEFGNTQGGNNNPWCQDNDTTWLDWKSQKTNAELTAFTKKLIAFRRSHELLHQAAPLTGGDIASSGFPDFSFHTESAWYGSFDPEGRHIGLMYSGTENGETTYLYIAYNFHWEEQVFALPYLPDGYSWQQQMSTAEEGELSSAEAKELVRSFRTPGRTVTILEGVRKELE